MIDWDLVIKEFISLWVVIDPIGTIPVFIAITAGLSVTSQRKIAIKSVLIATAILLFFLVGAQVLLEGLNFRLQAFQIAGGIILFLFALTIIFGEGKPVQETKHISGDASHLAVIS